MKFAVIYSSVTGNTQKLAMAAAEAIGATLLTVDEVLANVGLLGEYDCLVVGYWLRRGAPDEKTSKLLPLLNGRRVALFQTHGAYAGSEHAVTAFARAGALMGAGNVILGTFSCQCAVSEQMIELRLEGRVHGHKNEDLEACKKRWADAAPHPDAGDLERMGEFARKMLKTAERYM